MVAPTQRPAVLWTPPKHYGISYNAAKSPQNGGLAYAWAPGGALTQGTLTNLFTFTNDNKSYYMGSAGLLVPSVTNTPRIEYDILGNLRGLLLEGQRTNLALQSNDWTNAAWVKTTMTTAKTATGPDGVANSATTLTASAGNATAIQTVSLASATATFGAWIKRRTGSGNIQLTVDGGTGWTTKVITSAWAGPYFISQAAVTNPAFGIRIVTNGDAVDVWCGQLESAVSFTSSAIPTAGASVTRAADVCIRTLGAEYVAAAGTGIIIGDTVAALPDGTLFLYDFDDNTLNNRTGMQQIADGTIRNNIVAGGVTQALCTGGSVTSAGVKFRAASAWAANDFAATVDGATPGTDSAGSTPTVTLLELGGGTTGFFNLFMHVLSFDYYPTRITNANLQNNQPNSGARGPDDV